MRSLNHMEWYMSKRSRALKKRKTPELRLLANSMLSLCGIWGISVPIMDARARRIRRTIVSLTELKRRQIGFDLFCLSGVVMTVSLVYKDSDS
jgi:hypothetical protein